MGAMNTAAFFLTATLLASTPSVAQVNDTGGNWAAPTRVATPSRATSLTMFEREAVPAAARNRVRPRGAKLTQHADSYSRILGKATKSRAVQQGHQARTMRARSDSSRQQLRSFNPVTRGGINAQIRREHRIVIQVTQNDPALMNVALNNAENLLKHYEAAGEKVRVEFVAYGPGLHMVRSDTSPVKDRLSALSRENEKIQFSGCGNTMANQSKQENKAISLVAEARLVPTGIGRIIELQEQGWTYVRP